MKKAQIKMMETIFVLLVFFMLLGFGFIFYANYQNRQFEQSRKELLAKDAVDSALRILMLPELQCSRRNAITPNCIDKYKLEALKEMITADGSVRDNYFSIFGYGSITVEYIYPDDTIPPLVLYENSLLQQDTSASYPVTVAVNVQDSSVVQEDINAFGLLKILVQLKK